MAHKSDFVPADIGLQLTGLAESGRIIGTDLPEEDGASLRFGKWTAKTFSRLPI